MTPSARTPKPWQKLALIAAGLVAFEAATRIIAPGINSQVLRDFFQHTGGNLPLELYNRLGGGALARGGILALGVLPYVAAKVWMRIARAASPSLEAKTRTIEGRVSLTRYTRALTVGAAVIQSFGFAQMLQSIPDIVANPGFGFVTQTMLLLTGGAIVAMALAEQVAKVLAPSDVVRLDAVPHETALLPDASEVAHPEFVTTPNAENADLRG